MLSETKIQMTPMAKIEAALFRRLERIRLLAEKRGIEWELTFDDFTNFVLNSRIPVKDIAKMNNWEFERKDSKKGYNPSNIIIRTRKTNPSPMTISGLFLENLSDKGNKAIIQGRRGRLAIYLSLFKVLGADRLEADLKYLRNLSEGRDPNWKDQGKLIWFSIWHKSVRQMDYFSDCYRTTFIPAPLSKEELAELKFLTDKVTKKGYRKTSPVKGRAFNSDYSRYLYLHRESRNGKVPFSIDGHLDSILYWLVQVDHEGLLKKVFEQTFNDCKSNIVETS